MTEITQSEAIQDNAAGEWARGWPIVLSALIGIALCLSPLPYWALIVIGPELGKEFGWSRQVITGGFLYMTAGVLIGAPVAGQLVDRLGARKVLLPAIIALAFGTMSFALMTPNPVVFYTIFFVTAFLGAGTLPITWSKAIVNNFNHHRGLALGVALTGTGIYGFLAPTYVQTFINHFGWRWAYVAVGILPIIFSLPLAFYLFRDKKEEKALVAAAQTSSWPRMFGIGSILAVALFVTMTWTLTRLGAVHVIGLLLIFLALYLIYAFLTSKTKTPSLDDLPGISFRQAFFDYRFWVMFFSFMILGAVISGIIANSKNILLDKGYTDSLSTGFFTGVGLIGLSVLGGRLLGGWLVDFIWAPLVSFVFMTVPIFGCIILMGDHSVAVNAIALILVGVAAGVEFDMMAYFTSRYFGMRSYGLLYGLIYAGYGLGAGTSPILFNILRGTDTDYSSVLLYASIGFFIGAVMLLFMGRYRNFEQA